MGRITCGLWVNLILNDYVRTILNLNRSSSTWTLDPRVNFSNIFDPTGIPQGIGNQVSVEFNLIYRWHTSVSNHGEAWAKGFYAKIFPDQDPSMSNPYLFLPQYFLDFSMHQARMIALDICIATANS